MGLSARHYVAAPYRRARQSVGSTIDEGSEHASSAYSTLSLDAPSVSDDGDSARLGDFIPDHAARLDTFVDDRPLASCLAISLSSLASILDRRPSSSTTLPLLVTVTAAEEMFGCGHVIHIHQRDAWNVPNEPSTIRSIMGFPQQPQDPYGRQYGQSGPQYQQPYQPQPYSQPYMPAPMPGPQYGPMQYTTVKEFNPIAAVIHILLWVFIHWWLVLITFGMWLFVAIPVTFIGWRVTRHLPVQQVHYVQPPYPPHHR